MTRLLGIALSTCFLLGSLNAQEVRATIGGRVLDPAGAVVPGAGVTVVSDDTEVKQQTTSNNQGNWMVEFLLPGRYHFSVTAPGFKTQVRNGITLQTADNKQFDVKLEVGAASQSVEVTGETPLIDTTAATSGTVITTQELREMPTASHVATILATLSPGVMAQDQNGNPARMWSYNAGSQFTADGGRNNVLSNNFQLDGMPDTQHGGNVSFIPPMDSLQEFNVQTNAYDANIGRQAGATINMQTRSGGKNYHGTMYEFDQNSILNANLFQTNLVGGAVPPVHFNEWGATFGGPVFIPKIYHGRQKTFFFFSYDDTWNQDPRPGSTRSMPSELERKGDFSQSYTTQSGQRFPIQVYDPMTIDLSCVAAAPVTGCNRTPFPGNVIPTNRLSAISQNILKYVPLGNTTGDGASNDSNNFVSSATRQDKFPVVSVRLDQNWSNSQHSFLTVRWSHLHEFIDDFFHNEATGNFQERIPENAGIDHVWTVSPNKVLDLRFSVSRYGQPNYDKGSGFDLTQLGFSKAFAGELVKASFPHITGIAGDFGTNQAGTYYFNNYYTWAANLTHVHGNHTLQYGAEYWVLQDADGSIGAQPDFDFNNSNWTRQNNLVSGGTGVGSSLAAFLLGLPNGGNEPVNANGFYSQRFTALHFQDNWRATSRLTLNLGLRWDFETPVTERFNRLTSEFNLNAANPISPSAQAAYAAILASPANAGNTGVQLLSSLLPASQFKVPGVMLFAGVNGQTRGFAQPDYHEWQPRGGFAYQLGHNTVLRGGFGRFVQSSYERGGQNGFSQTTNFTATTNNYGTPLDTLANPFQGGILAPTGSSLGAYTNLGNGVDFNDPNPGRFHSWEYSLHLQHQLKSWLFEVGYSHNKTSGIYESRQQDNPSLALWQQYNGPQFDAKGKPLPTLLWNQSVPNPFFHLPGLSPTASIYTGTTTSVNRLLAGDPLLGVISMNDMPTGSNQYDAMLVKVEHRFSKGFSVINSFTWSKLFEDTSLLGPEIAGIDVEHKLGGEDRPFHLSVAPIWEIPFGRGMRFGGGMSKAADMVLGGWELSGTYTIQSGVPVVFGTQSFFTGASPALPRDQQSLSHWFDTSQFWAYPNANTPIASIPLWTGVQNLPGYSYVPTATDTIKNGVYQDFNTLIRTYPTRWGDVRASRTNEVNAGLYKNLRFTEQIRFQLRFETFNLFNHPRFGAPDTNPADGNFGVVTGSEQNSARTVQMGARLTF